MSPYRLVLSETSKWVRRTHQSKYAYSLKWVHVNTETSTRSSLRRVRRTDIDFEGVVEKPFRAILLHSPGRKPWVIHSQYIYWAPKGRHNRADKVKCSRYSAAPTELLIFVSSVYPGFHFGLCPHSTLGFAGVSPLQGSSTLSPPINLLRPLHNKQNSWHSL